MAVLNPDLVKEKIRENSTAEALIAGVPAIPGITCLRGITPLVMTALHRSNNPYVTGKAGFEAAGINFSDDGQIVDFAAFGVAMMPKTAEVLVLWTCDRQELKQFAVDPVALQSAALDFMEDFPKGMEGLAQVTLYVSKELEAINLTKAVPAENGEPKASTLEDIGPKKPARTGSHKS